MANYDIDFKISTSIDKQSQAKVEREIEKTAKTAERSFSKVKAAMDVSQGKQSPDVKNARAKMGINEAQIKAAYSALQKYVDQLNKVAELETQIRGIKNDPEYKKDYKNTQSRLRTAQKSGDTSKIEAEQAHLDALKAKVTPLEERLKANKDILGDMKTALTGVVTEFRKAGKPAEEIFQKLGIAVKETDEFAATTAKASSNLGSTARAAEGLVATEAKVATAKAKTVATTKEEDNSIKGLLKSYQEQVTELERLKAAGKDTTKAEEQLANTSKKIEDALKFPTASKDIADVTRRMLELQRAKRALEAAGIPKEFSGQYNQIVVDLERAKRQITAYKKGVETANGALRLFGNIASGVTSLAQKGFSSLVSLVKVIKNGFTNLGKSVSGVVKSIKSAINTIAKGINKIKSHFNSLSGDTRRNFKHMITSLTKYVLGFRSLFFLIRRIRKYIGEGIQNMAQFEGGNNHVNESITRLLSSLLYLKNAWATAFSPILQVVTPILEALIDKIAEVGNAFSRFLGSLLGVSPVFQAIKVSAADYAKSLDKAGGSAGKAADKTKKLTDRLAAFDDLNVLGKDNDPDATKSGGGGGADAYEPDPNEMFKLVNVGKHVQEELLKMWKEADFSELGTTVSSKIAKALNNIEWGKIQATVYKVGKSLITFINGALGDTTLWESVGKTLAEGLNTVSVFFRGILENNETDFGGGLARLINSLFTNIKWSVVQSNIVTLGRTIKENIVSFLQKISWSDIQSATGKIATALGQGITSITNDPELQAETWNSIVEFVRTVGIFFKNALIDNPIDIAGGISVMLSTVSDFINEEVSKLSPDDFKQAAETIGSAFVSILTDVNTFLGDSSGAFNTLLNGIATFITELPWEDIFKNTADIAATIVNALVDVLNTVASAMNKKQANGKTLAQSIGEAIGKALQSLDFRKIGATFAVVGQVLIDAIVGAIEGAGGITQILGALVEGFNGADAGSMQALTNAAIWVTIASYIVQGIIAALPIAFQAVGGLPGLLQTLGISGAGISELFAGIGAGAEGITALATAISTALPIITAIIAIIALIVAGLAEFTTATEDTREMLQETYDTYIGPIIDKLREGWEDMCATFDSVYNEFIQPVIDNMEKQFQSLWDSHLKSVFEGIFDAVGKVGELFGELWHDILVPIIDFVVATMAPKVSWFINFALTLVLNLVSIISSKIAVLIDWFNILLDFLLLIFTGDWETFCTNVGEDASKLVDDLVAELSGIGTIIANALIGALNLAISALNTMANGVESFLNGIISGASDIWEATGNGSIGKVSIGTIPSIPYLAQGAVIPPNKEFLAVLGDQSNGTNIEAPLDTIKQAVAEVMGTNAGNQEVIQLLQQLITVVENKNLTIGDKEIGKANARYTNQQRMIRGTSF